MDLVRIAEVGLRQDGANAERLNFRLSLKSCISRSMIVQEDVKSVPRQSQGKDLPETMSRPGHEGKPPVFHTKVLPQKLRRRPRRR